MDHAMSVLGVYGQEGIWPDHVPSREGKCEVKDERHPEANNGVEWLPGKPQLRQG